MSNTNYSLCAAYPLRSKPDKLMLFRLADYNAYSQEYMPILRTDPSAEIKPKIIGAKTSDVYPNLTEVRSWEYDDGDDRGRTFSYRHNVAFFEVVFPKELRGINYSDTNMIRTILLTGFSLEENACPNLMIVIGTETSRYTAVYCTKNKLKACADGRFSFPDNIADILHTTHFLLEYDIRKTDVIDTADIGIVLAGGDAAPTRYFYRFSELPPSNSRFHLFSLDTYIPHFVSCYIRKNKDIAGIRNADVRRISDTIQTILSSHEYISEYFEATGYTQEQLYKLLPEYNSTIIADMLSEQELDDAVRTTLFASEKIKRHCISVARNEWMQEQDQQRIAILDEISKLKDSKLQLEQQNKDALEQVASRQVKSDQLDVSISEKNAEMEKIQSNINRELKEFSENIVHSVALTSLVRAVSAEGTTECDKFSLIRITGFEGVGADDEIGCRADFEELLSENLETIGYNAEDSVDLSQLVTFCLCNKLPLVVENDGANIANTVSAMLGLSQTGIINLPAGFSDIQSLQAQIKSAMNTRTVAAIYVTGVFDGYNVGVFNALKYLMKEHSTPVFVVASLDGVTPEVLPHTIWESAMYLDDNAILQYAECAPLSIYKHIPSMSANYSEKEVRVKLKEIQPFADLIDRRAGIQLAKLMIDFNVSIADSATILQELFIFASVRGNAEKLGKVLSAYSVSDKTKRLIRKYM